MIAPLQKGMIHDGRRLAEHAQEAFGVGGIGAAGAPGDFVYEPRPQQMEMVRAISDALEDGGHLVVEAGTGIGKSLAYLVPLLLHSKRAGKRVMVSTHTIALQEQLMGKDLPLLRERLGISFRAVLAKGRANYLCLRRLARARVMQRDLFSVDAEEELERIRIWADQTEDGSLQELPRQPPKDIWNMVCGEQGNCMGKKCPERTRCFLQRARAQMNDADLLVANHHLVFSDLVMRSSGHGFLIDADAVVLDEAHTVEDTASEHLGIRLSIYAFEHWLRRMFVPETGKGILGYLRAGAAAGTVTKLWDAVADFFRRLPAAAGLPQGTVQMELNEPFAIETSIPTLAAELYTNLEELSDNLEDVDEDSRAEVRSLRSQGFALMSELMAFLDQSMEGHVYWIQREGKRHQPVMHSAPVEVAPLLRRMLFSRKSTVVMTSATLAVGGRLDYFRDRLGVGEEARLLCLDSPFDYARQVRVHAVTNAPDPKEKEAFAAAVAKGVLRWTRETHGRAFVLFTSDELLRRTREAVLTPLEEEGLTLLAQGQDLSRRDMLSTFRQDRGFVLFGLDSFWMGVDVRGEALSNVIITRLPFAVPDHPVVAARLRRIKERGGDPFREYSLPEAILKFRQGFGRLIRSQTDRGIVVVLDPRFLTKWYGRMFQHSLPECIIEPFEL